MPINSEYKTYAIHHEQMIADYIVSLQRANNPTAEFYRQPIQIFYSNDNNFTQKQSYICTNFQQQNTIFLSCETFSHYRIDFGELPCLIKINPLASSKQIANISSNATVHCNEWFLFLKPDPQLYCTLMGNRRPTHISVEVLPLFSTPSAIVESFSNSLQTELHTGLIAQNRWKKLLHNPIFRILLKLHRLIKK